MTSDPIPLWLDCDPGTDDAFAILLSAFHPKFKLLGISTVFGNTDLNQTTHNALGLLDVLHTDHVPVYRGEEAPLHKAPIDAHHVHGYSGMGDVRLPEKPKVKVSQDKSYIDAIKDAILEYENEICVLAVGAYTNIYKLFNRYPDLKSKIKYLSLMGGAFGFGNVTLHAEFNVYADPAAANYIFTDKILMDKIILNSLNLTHTVIATKEIKSKLFNKSSSHIRSMYKQILDFYGLLHETKFGLPGPPLHDPLAVFSVLPVLEKDAIYKYDYIRRQIKVIESGQREGETVFVNGSKITDSGNEEHGSIVGVKINGDLFFDYIEVALDLAEEKDNKS